MNILLDYVFKIVSITPTPAASTAFLKQVCLVVKPKEAVETGEATLCTTMAQVAALTANTEAQQLFDAGMSRVYILPMDNLDMIEALDGQDTVFFTVLISGDFSVAEATSAQASLVKGDLTFTVINPGGLGNGYSIEALDTAAAGAEVATLEDGVISIAMDGGTSTAIQLKAAMDANPEIAALITTSIASGQGAVAQAAFAEDALEGGSGLFVGTFKGVVGISSDNNTFNATEAAKTNRVAFYAKSTNKAKNMLYAFGKLLSNPLNWTNQQYIEMPFSDDVEILGDAEALFDDKISFVIEDGQYGNRLALFASGQAAIVAPYIKRNYEIDQQSKALQFMSGNQPAYTKVQAALLEDELLKVRDDYVRRQWIENGTVSVLLEQENFVGSGYLDIAPPRALWRLFGELRQTL